MVAALCGCGGTNTSSDGNFSLYSGSYTGTWASGSDTGTANFSFSGLGTINGTIVDTTTNTTYTISGTVQNPSSTSTVMTLTEVSPTSTLQVSGSITQTTTILQSTIKGTLTQTNGTTQTITITQIAGV